MENYYHEGIVAEKLSWFLEHHYNLFHADMIYRAILDDSVSANDFINGVIAIGLAESDDDSDEFTPEEFINV